MRQKGGNDAMLTNWYIHLMVKHGPALMAFIVRKQMRLIMYVLRWQQMSAMPKTLGKAGKTKSILVSFPTLPSVEEEALGKEFF
jgi:hypothetical protein